MASKRLRRHAAALLGTMVFAATTGAALSADADPALVEQGRYLAIAGDCGACHTTPGGKQMAGGLAIATPIGSIVATNITPSKTAGIGSYSLEQFADALRRGVNDHGIGTPYFRAKGTPVSGYRRARRLAPDQAELVGVAQPDRARLIGLSALAL